MLWCADVIGIEKTNEFFRLLYDIRGRFIVHRISPEEGKVTAAVPTRHDRTRAEAWRMQQVRGVLSQVLRRGLRVHLVRPGRQRQRAAVDQAACLQRAPQPQPRASLTRP